ncbi:MAG: hypothetical protein WBV89_01790 [Ilumatobacter sp.]
MQQAFCRHQPDRLVGRQHRGCEVLKHRTDWITNRRRFHANNHYRTRRSTQELARSIDVRVADGRRRPVRRFIVGLTADVVVEVHGTERPDVSQSNELRERYIVDVGTQRSRRFRDRGEQRTLIKPLM